GVAAGDAARAIRHRGTPDGDGVLRPPFREVHGVGGEPSTAQALDEWRHARRVAAGAVAEVDVGHSSRRRSCAIASASTRTTQITLHATIAGDGPLAAKNGLPSATNWPAPASITN